METKAFRSVGNIGSGSVVMVHDTVEREYRVEFDDQSYVFISFNYDGQEPVAIVRDEARERASLSLDLVAQTLRAVLEGDIEV